MSDDGTASRRATLPSAIQANGTGGVARRVRSSSRRVAASMTTDSIAEMSAAATRASCSATIAGRRPAQAAATSSTVVARAIAARRWNELRVATATRSESSTTPTTRPVAESDREVADPAVEHVEQDLAAAAVGGDRVGGRAHDLRDRRVGVGAGGHHAGAQVAVGHDPERRRRASTTTHVAPSVGHQLRAASRIVVSGEHSTSGARMSSATGRWAGLTSAPRRSAARSDSSSERVT